MADSTNTVVLVPRSGIDVHANSREWSRERFRGNADAIWQGRDLVKFDGVLTLSKKNISNTDEKKVISQSLQVMRTLAIESAALANRRVAARWL